jgi:outer membrane protein
MFSSSKLRIGATAVALLSLSVSGANAESLKAALAAAYAHNPTITSALYAVRIAAENIALRKSATRPILSAGLSVSDTAIATGAGGISNTQSAQVGLNYSQTVFDNHKTDANVEQARALVQVANQSLRLQESSVLLSVVQAYMNVILNTQLVTLRSDTVAFYQSQVKASQDRQNIGEGTKIDVAQARAALASAVAQQKAAVAGLQSAQASYKHWVGHAPRNLSSDFNYGRLIPQTVDTAMALGDKLNPSILAAKASIRAAQAGVDAANAAYGPTAGLTGSLGPVLSGPSGSSGTGLSIAGKVGFSMSLPIYSGGALGATTRQASDSQVKSVLDAQAAKDQVDENIVTAWSSLQNAAAQIDAAKSGVDAGQLALDGVVQERDVGQKTTIDVLNAESTITTAKEALISANATRVIAAFSLISAIGKLSSQDLALRAAPKSAQGYINKVEDSQGTEARSFND